LITQKVRVTTPKEKKCEFAKTKKEKLKYVIKSSPGRQKKKQNTGLGGQLGARKRGSRQTGGETEHGQK